MSAAIDPIRIGIVGLGRFGQMMTDEIIAEPQAQITAVCDPNSERAAALGKRLNARSHTDLESMLVRSELDAIYVAAPPAQHRPIVLSALEHGLHVLCEKPLGIDAVETAELVAAAQSSNLVAAVHFPLQYASVGRQWRRLHATGFEGTLRKISLNIRCPQWPRPYQAVGWVNTRLQGGPILEIGTHLIQLVQSIYGPLTVDAANIELSADPDRPETMAQAQMSLPDGTPVHLHAICGVSGSETVEIIADGTTGTLAMRTWGVLEIGTPGETLNPVTDTRGPSVTHEWCTAIRNAPAQLIDFEDAYRTQLVIDQLRRI